MVETRKSRSLILLSFRYLIMMRPSCGSRFSLISSLAMILMRLVMASRSFLGGAFQVGEVRLLFLSGEFQVSGVLEAEVLHDLVEFFPTLDFAVKFRDRLGNGSFGGHDRLHVEAGHELDIVHRKDVGWIGHRDGQRGAYAGKRYNLVADSGVLRYELDYRGIYLIKLKVNGWDAVLAGKDTRNFVIADE